MDRKGRPNSIIRFENTALGYGRRILLRDLDLSVEEGDFLGIIGPNGSGKTTILRAALGLLSPKAGEVQRDRSLRYGYVMQRQVLDPIYPFSVRAIVAMGRYAWKGPTARMGPADQRQIEEALRATGIAELAEILYRDLSAGQKQRVLIARALASEADVLLLDEPTNDLDVKGEETIMRLLRHIHRDLAKTVVFVSHLLHIVLNSALHIVFLDSERVVAHPIEEVLTGSVLSRTYGIEIKVREVDGRRVVIPEARDGDV